ncbi:hypothetical protein [Fodinicola feengrottensis]|uniref:hypothetical protein n=1 Tax=Fodinicola feengrottensis TaxID=435914 RepID=UPI0024411DF2|nr:hypothetical protein [Fodinicola feengrottensis]
MVLPWDAVGAGVQYGLLPAGGPPPAAAPGPGSSPPANGQPVPKSGPGSGAREKPHRAIRERCRPRRHPSR